MDNWNSEIVFHSNWNIINIKVVTISTVHREHLTNLKLMLLVSVLQPLFSWRTKRSSKIMLNKTDRFTKFICNHHYSWCDAYSFKHWTLKMFFSLYVDDVVIGDHWSVDSSILNYCLCWKNDFFSFKKMNHRPELENKWNNCFFVVIAMYSIKITPFLSSFFFFQKKFVNKFSYSYYWCAYYTIARLFVVSFYPSFLFRQSHDRAIELMYSFKSMSDWADVVKPVRTYH